MISVLSTTNKYILQPSLLDMHKQSTEWLSATVFWKREVAFFQKLLENKSSYFSSEEDKKKIGHFQSLVTYYGGELIDTLAGRLRNHENGLARVLQALNETDTIYYTEHKKLMEELDAFALQFTNLKHDLFQLIERSLK